MTLDDLYAALSRGELSNLSLANDGAGTITDAAKPKLLSYINEGLLKLYSRFVVKESEILIALQPAQTVYYLLPQYAETYTPTGSADNMPVRYLLDSAQDPFKDEVIKVLSIYNTDGRKVHLNDDSQPFSVFTPRAKTLQVPNALDWTMLSVLYQRRHPILQADLGGTIECPEVLLPALTAYVAHKVFSHMNSAESSAKAQEFKQTYEDVCTEAVDRDLVNSSISQSNTRFARGGWR